MGRGHTLLMVADDTMVWAESVEGVQGVLDRLVDWAARSGLTFAPRKTEALFMSADPPHWQAREPTVEAVLGQSGVGMKGWRDHLSWSVEIEQRRKAAQAAFAFAPVAGPLLSSKWITRSWPW